ncbi:MAG: hypothetical protein PHY08_06080 [Candidatus Cloacimonetes bacterium]|jgi:hypothetical protein|nr:hypothetical protein [Candidatus Cloacimonadota bacterium]MDD4156127.1 hypothetical protein [Candidatus Cloacimonadota bacterium]
MKLDPFEQKIIDKMQPGVLSLSGFLGKDNRHLHEIIEDDFNKLKSLNKTQEDIADRLSFFTDKSKDMIEDYIIIDDKYQVFQEVYRGLVLCPFNHKGTFKKAIIKLINIEKNIEIQWTPLNIHMIKEHCFFEGKGSHYRFEPEIIINAIF